jgi:hypothetical protein
MKPEMRLWASNAAMHGGSFLRTFADALLRADPENFAIIEPAATALMEKYQKYSEMGTQP